METTFQKAFKQFHIWRQLPDAARTARSKVMHWNDAWCGSHSIAKAIQEEILPGQAKSGHKWARSISVILAHLRQMPWSRLHVYTWTKCQYSLAHDAQYSPAQYSPAHIYCLWVSVQTNYVEPKNTSSSYSITCHKSHNLVKIHPPTGPKIFELEVHTHWNNTSTTSWWVLQVGYNNLVRVSKSILQSAAGNRMVTMSYFNVLEGSVNISLDNHAPEPS